MTHRKRLRGGVTTLEALVASTITVMVLLGVVMTLLAGMTSWYKGAGQINAQSSAQQAVRRLASGLRESMQVRITNDGAGLEYRLPELDDNGDCLIPAQWDGVERRVLLQDGEILMGPVGREAVVARNVVLEDPSNDNARYDIFSANEGGTVREVTIMLATRASGANDCQMRSKIRETVFLRNVP